MSGFARFTQEQRDYMIYGYDNGVPIKQIMSKTGLTYPQVSQWLKRLEIIRAREKALEQLANDPNIADDAEHICWGCYRATNPAALSNECSLSALDNNGNPRLELPEGVRRDRRGNIVECPLFISDQEGREKYGKCTERSEVISLLVSAMYCNLKQGAYYE